MIKKKGSSKEEKEMKKVTYIFNRRNVYKVIKPIKKRIKFVEEERDEKKKGGISLEKEEEMKKKEEMKKVSSKEEEMKTTKLYQA